MTPCHTSFPIVCIKSSVFVVFNRFMSQVFEYLKGRCCVAGCNKFCQQFEPSEDAKTCRNCDHAKFQHENTGMYNTITKEFTITPASNANNIAASAAGSVSPLPAGIPHVHGAASSSLAFDSTKSRHEKCKQ